jgi:hypothetical protein
MKCERCGEVNPAEIHTCTPHEYVDQRYWKYDPMTGDPLTGAEQDWVTLTSAETKALWNLTKKPSTFAEAIANKLKEKNVGKQESIDD